MKKQSLGRGLDSIIPRSQTAQSQNNNGFMELDITSIVPNDNQPRTFFDGELLEELAQSIRDKGVIQPIIVTKTQDDKYMIIEGERRWRASGMAGKKTIPALLRNVDTPKERLELALITNAQREDLNPVELAKAYAKLIDDHGYRQEDVSQAMGRSRSAVANRLRLLTLPEPVLIALEDKDITEGHAKALLGLHDKGRINEFLMKITDKSLTVRDVENAVKRANEGKERKPQTALPVHVAAIQAEMEGFFKSKVNIKNKAKGGVIEIKYSSDDELDTIIKKIRGEIC